MQKKLLSILLTIFMLFSLCSGVASAASVSSVSDLALGISGKYVYYPTELTTNHKKYPVVTWANGSWCPVQTYLAIIKGIAEAGYIVVADTDLLTDDGKSTVDSVDWILEQNQNPNSLFYGRVDTGAIGATGHSLGGQAAVNASGMDSRIKAIVSIAGKSTADEAVKVKVPALYLAGTLDMIVPAADYVYPSYQASRGPKAYASLTNVEHFACWYEPQEYLPYITAWFDAYLKKDSSKIALFQKGGQLSKDADWTDFQCANLTAIQPARATKLDTNKTYGVAGASITILTDRLSDTVYAYSDLNDLSMGKYIYYPVSLLTDRKTYPVIIWSNGSWCPVQTYYGYIQRLVEAGYVVISDTDLYTKSGASVLDSLEYIKNINADDNSFFYQKLDVNHIGAVGHSLGGEAVINACSKTKEIKCLVSLQGYSSQNEVHATNPTPTLYFGNENDINVPKDKYVKPSFDVTKTSAVYAYAKNVEHFAVWYQPDLYTNYSIDWFDIYLRGNQKKRQTVFGPKGTFAKDSRFAGYENNF